MSAAQEALSRGWIRQSNGTWYLRPHVLPVVCIAEEFFLTRGSLIPLGDCCNDPWNGMFDLQCPLEEEEALRLALSNPRYVAEEQTRDQQGAE